MQDNVVNEPGVHPLDLSEPIDPPAPCTPRPGRISFITLMGVVLPVLAMGFELATGFCRMTFFDPLPTFFHIAMFATIPLSNARLVLALSRDEPGLSAPWALLHVFSIGVAFFYSLVFLPITPVAVIALIFMGLGLLALAPMLAVLCGLLGRKEMKRSTGQAPGRLWHGLALAAVALMLVEAPASLTRIGMHMATDGTPEARLRGIKWLRAVGNEAVMLRLCYRQQGRATDLFGTLLELHRNADPEQARVIFYQMTGEAFNSRPAPVQREMREWLRSGDEDVGGAAVGQRVDDVELTGSRMDASLDARAGLGYLEWTMTFHNNSAAQQEGRAEIALPPGGSVSRVTLWINGEEHEAAFGGRSQVRAAYQAVVRQRRDPLLVTTAGTDRVLVQFFPIMPHDDMKIRLGISTPMTVNSQGEAQLQLPAFSERNFELGTSLPHAVWIESSTPLKGDAGLVAERTSAGLFALRGNASEPQPGQAAHVVTAPGVQPVPMAWGDDDKGKAGNIVVQKRSLVAASAPARVALVLDGSASMREAARQLAGALADYPQNVELALVVAGDGLPVLFPHDRARPSATTDYLMRQDYVGGRDSSAALALAWDWAGQVKGGSLVWIHGAQPVLLGASNDLAQRIERRAGQVQLVDVTAARGANLIAQQLDGVKGVTRIAAIGTLDEQMRTLFRQWKPGATVQRITRERMPAAGSWALSAKTSPHLARLWAADEVASINARPDGHDAAVKLASLYQLVTPVSGAVVLETEKESQQAGLQPVPPGSVPTIPEPETWMLIVVSLMALGFWHRRRRA